MSLLPIAISTDTVISMLMRAWYFPDTVRSMLLRAWYPSPNTVISSVISLLLIV